MGTPDFPVCPFNPFAGVDSLGDLLGEGGDSIPTRSMSNGGFGNRMVSAKGT